MRKTGWQHDILLSKFLSNMYFSPGRCHINFVWHYVNPCKYYRKLVECRNGGFSRLLVATSFPISFRSCKGIQIPESVKFLLVESGILLRIGIQNPSSTDKESGIQYLESRIHGVRRPSFDRLLTAWNRESKTVFDSFMWGESFNDKTPRA